MTAFENATTRRLALAALGAGIAASTMAADAIAAPADTASLEKAVEELRAAMVSGDSKVLNGLLQDHLSYSHSDGKTLWNKAQFMDNYAGKHAFVSIAQSNYTYDVVGNVGVVRFVFDGVANNPDGTTSKSHINVLAVWVRSRRGWQLLARASTIIPPT
jgi:hypothetical protein